MRFVQQTLVSNVKQLAPNVRVINYVTDGGPSHFRNQYNILNLTFHETDFGVRAIWTFSATSYGKGLMDGLGEALLLDILCIIDRHAPKINNRISLFQTCLIVYESYKQIVGVLM